MALTVLDSGLLRSTSSANPRLLTIPVHASAIAVLVFAFADVGAAGARHTTTGMTLGGEAPTGTLVAVDDAIEPGQTLGMMWTGTEMPASGDQTLSIGLTAATLNEYIYSYINVGTDADELSVTALDSGITEGDQANPSIALSYGGVNGRAFAGLYSGRNSASDVTPGSGATEAQEGLFASNYRLASVIYQTTPGASDFSIGWTISSTDDVAAVARALRGVTAAGTDANAGHSVATLASYAASVSLKVPAGHASITFSSYVPTPEVIGSPSGAYAGHASIDFWASEGGYSDLDSDSGTTAATVAAHQPSVSVKATAQHAAIAFAAVDASVGYPGSVFAGHASITFASGGTSHGVAAGHASISAGASDTDYNLGAQAGQASPQFVISAFDAEASSATIHNASAGHASITMVSYQPRTSGTAAAGHASITLSGLDVSVPAVAATLTVEVYNAVTLDVDVSLYVDVTLDVEVY